MGEEKEKEKKGNGEEKGDGGKKKEKGGGEGGEKKEEGPLELKLDMHCDGCALKIRKLVKGFEGVEGVSVDSATNKLKVVGKVDAWKLKEFLEAKTRKKVEFISPKDPPKKPKDDGGEAKKEEPKKEEPKKEEKGKEKPMPPVLSTVVLKIRLHCDGCIRRIKRNIYKIKGVDEVTVDAAKDLVTVKGTMNVKTLPEVLKAKLKRGVEIVAPKKEEGGGGGDGEKKDGKKGGGDGEKKKEGGGGVDGEKKEKDKDGGGGKKDAEPAAAAATTKTVAEANKLDYYGVPYPAYAGYTAPAYGGYGYRVEMVHAPQMFSDENPNACSVM